MATGKKSFIAYSDWRDTFDQLPDEDAGKLIKHIFSYVNDEDPQTDSVLINAVFAQIKNALKRDLQKWDKQLNQRKEAGKKSAERRAAKSNDRSTTVKTRQRNSTDSVNVSDSVSVSVNVSDNVNETNKDNIDSRKLKFAESLKPYVDQYGREMLIEFRDYWTEHNDNGKKMRFEYAKNQPFNVSRRLATWSKRNQEKQIQGKQTKKRGEGVNAEYLQELQQRLNPNK